MYLHKKEAKWADFLRQHIFLDKGVYNILSRQDAIFEFISEGLVPYLNDIGYIWLKSPHALTKSFLHALFEMWLGNEINIPNLQKGFSKEHYQRYIELLDAAQWDYFWSKWSELEDFSEVGYAYRMRFMIQNFVWNNIDLAHSSVTAKVEEEMKERKVFEDMLKRGEIAKGKDDPYLQDIQHSSYSQKHDY